MRSAKKIKLRRLRLRFVRRLTASSLVASAQDAKKKGEAVSRRPEVHDLPLDWRQGEQDQILALDGVGGKPSAAVKSRSGS